MTLDSLNALEPSAAHEAFRACCGASRWIAHMVDARPYSSADALLVASDRAWAVLGTTDIQEAIAQHPRIGEPTSDAKSAREQASALAASTAVRAVFSAASAQYEQRFGHRFIVCAAGRSAEELLAALRLRSVADAATELATTSEELRKITALRLGQLLADS